MESLFDKVMSKCDEAELFKKEENILEIQLSEGKVQSVKGNNNVGISLRINKDGKSGSAVSTSLDDETIIERAILSSKYQKAETLKFTNEEPSDVKCFDEKVANLSVEDMKAEAQRILDIFSKYDEELVPIISVGRIIHNIHIINSSGFNHSYNKTEYSIGLGTKSSSGFTETSYGITVCDFRQITEKEIADVIHKHHISQNRVKVKTAKMPVVFSGSAVGSLMTRLLAGVNGENVIKGVSPLEGKIGQKILPDNITIRDNGIMDYGKGSSPFDDEGCPTNNTVLVENGVLKNYLVGVSGEEKLSMKATGNSFKRTMFSKDIEDAPAIDSTNFLIEGNNVSDEELIAGIDKGIYIDFVMGTHTGNIAAGEYSLNIGIGYLIENGKLTGKVMDTMVAGNIYEDLMKIQAIGTREEAMKVVFYTMGYSPAVLFKDLSVVGGE